MYRKTLVWIWNNMFLIWTGILPSMSKLEHFYVYVPVHTVIDLKQNLQCFSTHSWETYSWGNATSMTSLTTCNWLIVKLHKLYRVAQIFMSKRSDPAPDQARNRIQLILIVYTKCTGRYYSVCTNDTGCTYFIFECLIMEKRKNISSKWYVGYCWHRPVTLVEFCTYLSKCRH